MCSLAKFLRYVFVFSFPLVHAAPVVEINEDFLKEMAKKGAPQIDQIQSSLLSAKVRASEIKEDFAPELFGKAAYAETNERALIRFQPVFTPIAQAQLGVRKKLENGLQTSAQITTDQRSASATAFTGKFQDATTTVLSFTVQMDLWKDLFGRLSKAKLENAQLETKRAELEQEIQTKSFFISLRRIYWSLVANQEALKISEELLGTAKSQASETTRRFKSAVAEVDEVARYNAQVASREGTILYLKYQRETFLKQLKNLLPELSASEVTLAKYNLNETLNEVLACTQTISKEVSAPYQFTKYDEATSLLRQIKQNTAKINSRYSDVDVNLYGTVKATGVSAKGPSSNNTIYGSYGGAIDDIESTNRSGYEVGINFTLPLGETKKDTQKVKELYDEKRLMASIANSDAQVINSHQELLKSVGYLAEVIKAQKINSSQLATRLKYVRKKYEQARVSETEMVLDQDALLNAELSTIDTQLQILNVFFDYLAIYTDTPCSFNRTL